MKTRTKCYITFAILFCIISNCYSQLNHPGRGMYVSQFFSTSINPSGTEIVNYAKSILTIASKENQLLQYAKDNHITYLVFYDLHHVLGTAYETDLCSFFHKAKTMYCIELIGIASSCASLFDETGIVSPTPVYNLAQNLQSSPLDFVQNYQDPNSFIFYRSETAKLFLRASDFNDNCAEKIDVFVTEYEFWNDSIQEDNCIGGRASSTVKWERFQRMIEDMDLTRETYNSSHSPHKIYTEAYLGKFDNNDDPGFQNSASIATWLDNIYTSPQGGTFKRLDRMNTIYYWKEPYTLYDGGIHHADYVYNTRFLELCKSTTRPNTIIHPMFSAEYIPWIDRNNQNANNYLGYWINQDIHNNIFTAEKEWYDDWLRDATASVRNSVSGNIVQPGGVQWFTSKYMVPHFKDPILFTSNSPVCVQSGSNGTFHFDYQGPIEKGLSYKFYITNAGTNTVRCGNTNSITWPDYNVLTYSSINLDNALGICSLPVGEYDAHLELTYSSGCTYAHPPVPISITNSAQIVSSSTISTVCVGDPIYLQASSTGGGTTTYQWLVDGVITASPVSTEYFYAPKPPTPSEVHTHIYSCNITSSLSTCSANPSNVLTVNYEETPVPSINLLSHTQCSIVLEAQPAGMNYLWHDSSTSNIYSTDRSGTYSVLVTSAIAGCSNSASYTYQKHKVTIDTTTNTCFGGSNGSVTLTIENGTPEYSPYIISWTGSSSGSLSPNPAGVYTIQNLAAGNYIFNITDRDGCIRTRNAIVESNTQISTTISSTGSTTICPGGSVGLNANGVGSFLWSPPQGLNCINCANVIASPNVTTTYVATLTNANGCTASSSSIITVSRPSVSITPVGIKCIGTQICATAGFASYNWLPNHETTSCIPTSSSSLNYSVVVTDANGCSASASANLSQSCCVGGILLDQAYFNSHSTISTGSYNLNSNIILNQNTNLDNCQITIAPEKSISTNGYSLNLKNGAELSACGNMWRGIIVDNNGTFTSSSTSTRNKIYDAQYGVEVRDNGTINIDKCDFINDYIGVNMYDLSVTGPIHINGYIKNSSFSTVGSLKAYNPSSVPYFQYTHSFAGIRAYNVSLFNIGINDGVSINRFNDLNFGIHSTKSNLGVTDYAFQKIKKYDSPPNANTSDFGSAAYSNGSPTPNYLTMSGRKNIADPDFQECVYAVNSLNSNIDIKLNRIENCDFGIYVSQGNSLAINAANNYIDCNTYGISLIVVDRFSHSQILSNSIYGGQRSLTVSELASGTTGINIAGFNLNNTNTLINLNTIHLFDFGLTGIELNAIKNSIVDHNYVTLHNSINQTMKGISLYGSSLNNISCNSVNGTNSGPINYSNNETAFDVFLSQANDIKCNTATETSNGYRFSGNCHGGTVPTTLRSNDIGYHFNGLVYSSSAQVDPQINQGNWWYQNTYPGYAALNLSSSILTVDNERFFVYASLASNYNYPVPSEIFAVAPWFYAVPTADANCGNIGSHRSDCNIINVPNPGGGGGTKHDLLDPVDESIASGESNPTEFTEETQWNERVNLYEKLIRMPDYKDEYPILTDFFENQDSTSVQQVATIKVENELVTPIQETLIQSIENNSASIYQNADTIRVCDSTLSIVGLNESEKTALIQIRSTAINNLNQLVASNSQQFIAIENAISDNADQLNIQNEDISGSEVYEQNEQVINDIYLNGIVAKSSEYFNGNLSSIYTIAQQCPLAGGPAVFRARTLYKLIDPNMRYNDDLACLQAGKQLRNASKTQFPVGVFPNPASTEVTITYAINTAQLLQIIDNLGRICIEVLLDPKENRITKNISNLSDGIYSLRLNGKDNIQSNIGRLTIMK